MSTNRTKIDWAYKQATRIAVQVITSAADERPRMVRHIAAVLRRAESRGRKNCWCQNTLMDVAQGRPMPVRSGKTTQVYNYMSPKEPTDRCNRCGADRWKHGELDAAACSNFREHKS